MSQENLEKMSQENLEKMSQENLEKMSQENLEKICKLFISFGTFDFYRKKIRYIRIKRKSLLLEVGLDKSYEQLLTKSKTPNTCYINKYEDLSILEKDFSDLVIELVKDFVLFENNILFNCNSLMLIEYVIIKKNEAEDKDRGGKIVFSGIDFVIEKKYKTVDEFRESELITRTCFRNLYFYYEKDLLDLHKGISDINEKTDEKI